MQAACFFCLAFRSFFRCMKLERFVEFLLYEILVINVFTIKIKAISVEFLRDSDPVCKVWQVAQLNKRRIITHILSAFYHSLKKTPQNWEIHGF